MKKNNNNKSNLKKNLMLYTSGPRSAGGPAAGRSARARALQTRGHPYQAWRRAGWQPAPPSTNLGVTGHPGPAAEARLVMKKKWAHIYTRLDAAPAGRLVVCRPMAIRCTRLGAGRAGSQPASTDLRVTGRLKPHVIPKPKNL